MKEKYRHHHPRRRLLPESRNPYKGIASITRKLLEPYESPFHIATEAVPGMDPYLLIKRGYRVTSLPFPVANNISGDNHGNGQFYVVPKERMVDFYTRPDHNELRKMSKRVWEHTVKIDPKKFVAAHLPDANRGRVRMSEDQVACTILAQNLTLEQMIAQEYSESTIGFNFGRLKDTTYAMLGEQLSIHLPDEAKEVTIDRIGHGVMNAYAAALILSNRYSYPQFLVSFADPMDDMKLGVDFNVVELSPAELPPIPPYFQEFPDFPHVITHEFQVKPARPGQVPFTTVQISTANNRQRTVLDDMREKRAAKLNSHVFQAEGFSLKKDITRHLEAGGTIYQSDPRALGEILSQQGVIDYVCLTSPQYVMNVSPEHVLPWAKEQGLSNFKMPISPHNPYYIPTLRDKRG